MEDRISGWGEIAKYLRLHPRTAQQYERSRGLPVHRLPGGGPKAPVFAFKAELDAWLSGNRTDASDNLAPGAGQRAGVRAEIAGPVLDRILRTGQDTKLYRRDYVLRFAVRPSVRGIQANIEYSYELCNATDQPQPFVQLVTVDDGDHGHVEGMSFSVNEKLAYVLKKPAPTQRFIGYTVYEAPKQWIAPSAKRLRCLCRASWVMHRSESDIWYNHMLLPTVGVRIETHATSGFEITPSYSISDLVMKAEHLDIAWRRRS